MVFESFGWGYQWAPTTMAYPYGSASDFSGQEDPADQPAAPASWTSHSPGCSLRWVPIKYLKVPSSLPMAFNGIQACTVRIPCGSISSRGGERLARKWRSKVDDTGSVAMCDIKTTTVGAIHITTFCHYCDYPYYESLKLLFTLISNYHYGDYPYY